MPMNVDRLFIQTALDALRKASLTEEQELELCDTLVELCHQYAPGTFINNKKFEEDDEY
jgi:hypothetical protein